MGPSFTPLSPSFSACSSVSRTLSTWGIDGSESDDLVGMLILVVGNVFVRCQDAGVRGTHPEHDHFVHAVHRGHVTFRWHVQVHLVALGARVGFGDENRR